MERKNGNEAYRVSTGLVRLKEVVRVVNLLPQKRAHLLFPISFMNILTSDVFQLPSDPLVIVNSVPAMAWRAATDTKFVYTSDIFAAALRIWVSISSARA